MTVQFYNLGFTLYHAENAQQAQNLFHAQERGGNEIAAARTQEVAKEEQNTLTQQTNEVESRETSPDNTGAHSHSMLKREEEEDEEKKKDESLPDPSGRGQSLDVKM